MTDFFDWLTASDSGLAAERLREHYRLSQQEMRRTTEALAPAFLFALQRLAVDSSAWTDFMRRLARLGPDEVSPGFDSAAPAAAGSMLGKLFGTEILSEAVARHASMMAGVAPDIIRKMMPELALITVQTMMRMAQAQTGLDRPGAMPTDAGGQAMAELMRRSANAMEAFSRPASSTERTATGTQSAYLETLFSDALRGGFPWMAPPVGGQAQTGAATAAPPFFVFAPLFEAFAGRQDAETRRPPEEPSRSDTVDPLSQMTRWVDAGRSMQETYALEMLALFDRHRRGA